MQSNAHDRLPKADQRLVRFVWKHWPLISAVVLCAVSLGVVKGKYSGVEGRLDYLEQAHPDATAAVTLRNAQEMDALRRRIDRMGDDVSATRVDVARLCARWGIEPTGEPAKSKGAEAH